MVGPLYLALVVAAVPRPLPTAAPEEVGLDAEKLRQAVDAYAAALGGAGVERMVVARHGCVVWRGPRAEVISGVRGLPKAVTSLVFGTLVDDGIVDLDLPAARHEPRLAGLYPRVTLRHFLTNTSGYRGIDDDEPHAELFSKPPRRDPFMPIEPQFAPGTNYHPSDTAIAMSVLVATRAAGEAFEDIFWRRLGDPIGVDRSRFSWSAYELEDGARVNGGAGHFHGIATSADELTKLAVLLANDGEWNGRRLISRDYLRAATEVQADRPQPNPRFVPTGYLLRTLGVHSRQRLDLPDLPIRSTWGMASRNTSILVVPEWGLAIVRLADDRPEAEGGSPAHVAFLAAIGAAIRTAPVTPSIPP